MGPGTRVTVDWPERPRWHDEPGVVLAQNPPKGQPAFYVVAVAGWQVLVPATKVQAR